MVLVSPEKIFTVVLFNEGSHENADGNEVRVNTTLPELPVLVERWDITKESCCWEAYDERDICVAYRGCRGGTAPVKTTGRISAPLVLEV